jgi:DNA-binding beta-propeller fold protein YncE
VPGALRVALPATLLVVGLVTGCGTVRGSADQQAVAPAAPAVAPPRGANPAGMIVPLGSPATEVVFDPRTRTVAIALVNPPRLLLRALDDATSVRQVPLPGPAAGLALTAGDGRPPSRTDLDGPVRGAVALGDVTVAALGDRLTVFEGNRPRTTIRDFVDAAQLVPAGTPAGTKVWVLDRGRTAVSVVDLSTGETSPALRAGNGAANAVADRFSRILVTDARDGELLAFAGDPPMLRQRFPLAGAPYGLAYDGRRDLAWVTLTALDVVVGLGVAGGEPVIVHRFPTVHQPDAVAVDPVSGRVLVVSASGAGLQIIDPGRVVQ